MKNALTVIAVVILLIASALFDFHVWRLQHPGAPTWTYFVQSK
jgi:uncharacterized protein YxeA